MEKDYKTQLYNKESQIIQLQTKIELLNGNKKTYTNPEIKRVFISNSSKGKQNINYNNYDLYNNKQYQKKGKNQTLDYLSQLTKNKTINILNNNISIKTIKNYHPNNLSINNNISENKIPLYKFPENKNYKYESQRRTLEKNNSAPNIHLHNIDVNSNNVRKKFFLNNTKKNKNKNSKIKVRETGIKYLLKEKNINNIHEDKEKALYQKNNYKKVKLPIYIMNNNQNFAERLKINLNTNTINENLIQKIKDKNMEEFNKLSSLKFDEMENLDKTKVNAKKNVKSCESRKFISPHKKLQKKFNKIMSSSNMERDFIKNNSTFNHIFKNLNNEKGERSNYLKNIILHNKGNDLNNNFIFNLQMDKSSINNSRKINLNNLSEKIYLESYNKALSKKSN